MPLYLWICDCGEEIEHHASIENRDVPPNSCPTCCGIDLKREPFNRPSRGSKGFVLEGHGWHDQLYNKYKGY